MKRVLFLVYELGNLGLGWAFAERARARQEFQLVLWSPYGFAETDSLKRQAIEKGAIYINETTASGSLADIWTPISAYLSSKPPALPIPGEPGTGAWPPRKSEELLRALDAETSAAALRAADACLRRIAFCEDILVRLGINAVVMAEDNVERDSFGWIAAARRRSISTAVVSYGAPSLSEAEHAYAGSAAHQIDRATEPVFRERLAHWTRQGPQYWIARLPPVNAIGRCLAGLDQWNPWLVNTGAIDGIMLESRSMRDRYLSYGYPRATLKVVGHPAMDRMFHFLRSRPEARRKLAHDHGFEPGQPLILVAMPPDQTSTRSMEFGAYSSILDVFSQTPRAVTGAAVVVSLHPNARPEHKMHLQQRGISVVSGSASDWIPLADLFIASVSSTIKWALACGVPVIDYDVYGYHYPDFLGLAQVITASDHAGFTAALHLWAGSAERARLQRAAARDRNTWGETDGRAMDRIVDLVLGAGRAGNESQA